MNKLILILFSLSLLNANFSFYQDYFVNYLMLLHCLLLSFQCMFNIRKFILFTLKFYPLHEVTFCFLIFYTPKIIMH